MHSVLPHSPRSSWWRLQFNWVWLGRWGSFFRIISSQRLQYLYRRLCAVLSRSVLSDSLQPHGLYWLLCPWGFSRQEYWSALPCPPSGELPNPEFKPRSAALRVDSLSSEPPGKPIKGSGNQYFSFSSALCYRCKISEVGGFLPPLRG